MRSPKPCRYEPLCCLLNGRSVTLWRRSVIERINELTSHISALARFCHIRKSLHWTLCVASDDCKQQRRRCRQRQSHHHRAFLLRSLNQTIRLTLLPFCSCALTLNPNLTLNLRPGVPDARLPHSPFLISVHLLRCTRSAYSQQCAGNAASRVRMRMRLRVATSSKTRRGDLWSRFRRGREPREERRKSSAPDPIETAWPARMPTATMETKLSHSRTSYIRPGRSSGGRRR